MSKKNELYVGIDIGSTTVKIVVMNTDWEILYKEYTRHLSRAREKTLAILSGLSSLLDPALLHVAITGSAGLGVSRAAKIEFVQEVYATRLACDRFLPQVDAVIELGGEDAKILFITGGSEERMNGSCAGGTGAFIDQMASLLNVDVPTLDALSLKHEKIYNIASRCGVFAKSDIQPLLNQGARKEDIAASIFQAIVDQTISGLAQGREIKGNVAFLGGPLAFLQGLRDRFSATLTQVDNAIFPEDAEYFIARGAALYAKNIPAITYEALLQKVTDACHQKNEVNSLPPLFENEEDYLKFVAEHEDTSAQTEDISTYTGDAYLGVDAGSTTTKLALITPDGKLLYQFYESNSGELVSIAKRELTRIRELCGDRITIRGAAATGYGEELIKNAFHVDFGIVETVAHYYAARHFNPDVDFILDIGGQDIKCFKIRNNAIDSIILNEACSSGCGSFIETFASAWGYTAKEFASLGIYAKHPVNLGSRCTVFMNSSVKQAQKDGAGIDDISAGLAVSVIKNALYKVIRARSVSEIGRHIVVQGGTFLNDAILRSFELETGFHVTRPSIAGLMGAYGAALYAKEQNKEKSTLLELEELRAFTHTSKMTTCGLCTNRCKLTVNIFSGKDRFISGNRCERPLGKKGEAALPNAFEYKVKRLFELPEGGGSRGKIGIPVGLNMYENLPFWHTLLTRLGFTVVLSDMSTRATYVSGQHTIPSDTVCYPAKLMHGHIENLLEKGVDTIFYPCMTYNFDEHISDNHFNCPVVAYYPELLKANIAALKEITFLNPYFSPRSDRTFANQIVRFFAQQYRIPKKEVREAVSAAFDAYRAYRQDVLDFGQKAISYARENGKTLIILCGRPYHIDLEINHGIDRLISSLDMVIISEDCLPPKRASERLHVLNQWTYHARLYAAARYATQHEDTELVQLVSFGCGLDAITTDEVREILESKDKLYTQLKIDEINNLGAAKIRLRSLEAAIEMKKRGK